MFHNGWEFYILNPFSKEVLQTTQELYIENYNKSYVDFINLLLIPEPLSSFFDESGSPVDTFVYYTNCEGDLDIINKDSDYEFKFLKSKFFEKKSNKIRKDLSIYYSQWGIKVNSIFRDGDNYYINLFKY